MSLRTPLPLRGVLFLALLAGGAMADERIPHPIAAVNATNGIALKGYDPIAYFMPGKPTPGTTEFSSSWNGATYRFASSTDLSLFTADPEKYAPIISGDQNWAALPKTRVDSLTNPMSVP